MTSRLFFVMSHDHTRSPVQWNPQPKRPQDFSGKLEVGGILNFFQLIISFFRAIKTCSPNFVPCFSSKYAQILKSKKCASFLEIRNCWWSFKWCFLKKPREQAGSDSSPFPGVSRFLSLPGCRCSRSTNGSTTTDPCIGGGLGIWPTHGLISGEVWGWFPDPELSKTAIFHRNPTGMP